MPKIQYGKTMEVPLDTDGRKVWFLLQHIESGAVVNECLGGKTHKKLRQRLASPPLGLKYYAIWNGKHHTDLFDIDIPVMLERLDDLKKRRKARSKKKK
jgi:hypothetical protein